MKLTHRNIKQQEFHKAVRGYDVQEVKNFLEKVADEYEELTNTLEVLEKENEKLKSQIDEYKRIEKNLQKTLLSAQESTSKTVESVKKQTALMLKEAELKSKQMIEKAKDEAESIRNSVAKLREEKKYFLARLSAMVESQEKLLNASFTGESEKMVNKEKLKTTREINTDDLLEKLV